MSIDYIESTMSMESERWRNVQQFDKLESPSHSHLSPRRKLSAPGHSPGSTFQITSTYSCIDSFELCCFLHNPSFQSPFVSAWPAGVVIPKQWLVNQNARVYIPIPLAATSVATMIGAFPDLNSLKTQSLSCWSLSPWIANAGHPSSLK